MDSFLIYAEPFVLTGGGPGNSTTFLSIYLVKVAVGQFDLGPAAAFSLIYFLIILLFSYMFFQALRTSGKEKPTMKGSQAQTTTACSSTFCLLLLPIYWMVNMSPAHQRRHPGDLLLLSDNLTLENYRVIFTDPSWYSGYINSIIYVSINTLISR